jgi:hypothetical protein
VRQFRSPGSVEGAPSNGRPYSDRASPQGYSPWTSVAPDQELLCPLRLSAGAIVRCALPMAAVDDLLRLAVAALKGGGRGIVRFGVADGYRADGLEFFGNAKGRT